MACLRPLLLCSAAQAPTERLSSPLEAVEDEPSPHPLPRPPPCDLGQTDTLSLSEEGPESE